MDACFGFVKQMYILFLIEATKVASSADLSFPPSPSAWWFSSLLLSKAELWEFVSPETNASGVRVQIGLIIPVNQAKTENVVRLIIYYGLPVLLINSKAFVSQLIPGVNVLQLKLKLLYSVFTR